MAKQSIYHAAALFSGRESVFNVGLNEALEELGYVTFLPQRDGFEFVKLHSALEAELPPIELEDALQSIIYFLDIGKFLSDADIVVANLDEPLDEGVVVEVSYAKNMGKPVVGFRTDSRSPFGRSEHGLGGIHFFPAYQCDAFIKYDMRCWSNGDVKSKFCELAKFIDKEINNLLETHSSTEEIIIPNVNSTQEIAKILFDDVGEINTPAGLSAVVDRYKKNKILIEKLVPKMIKN